MGWRLFDVLHAVGTLYKTTIFRRAFHVDIVRKRALKKIQKLKKQSQIRAVGSI